MARRTDPEQDQDNGYDGPSKTTVKKAMLELQDLGAAMLDLPQARFDAIEMDDNVREGIEEMRRLKAHSARKRQMQYVGKLLRNGDAEPLRRALADFQASRLTSARAHHEIEEWRDRLLKDDEALNAWRAAYPASDVQQLRARLRDARREVGLGQHGRAYRELFKALRTVLQPDAAI